jgi:hypothetical protein
MNNATFPLIALSLAVLAGPAFATHPNEVCHISVDTAALAKSKGAEPGPVKVLYVFRTYMTDPSPAQPQVASKAGEDDGMYKAEIYSCPYYRTLASVTFESVAAKPDGTPVWSATFERPETEPRTDAEKKAAPISCETYAD